MTRRIFYRCLNKEFKIYNCSVGSIVFGILALLFGGLVKGFVWGIGFFAVGFILGRFLSKRWYEGDIQRQIYWHIPFAKYFVDKNMPESHHRKIM